MFYSLYSKIVRQCYYCWRLKGCKPSNFAVMRSSLWFGLDILRKNSNKYNCYGKTKI